MSGHRAAKGDLDTDGDEDRSDLHTLIFPFTTDSGEGDINGGGQVNDLDLLLFLNDFGHYDCMGTP